MEKMNVKAAHKPTPQIIGSGKPDNEPEQTPFEETGVRLRTGSVGEGSLHERGSDFLATKRSLSYDEEQKTASSPRNEAAVETNPEMESFRQRNLFMVMAMNMTWQLAIAVLVPVVGGYYLDQHFNTTPLWVIVGAVVALLGVIGILKRIVAEAGRKTGYQTTAKAGGKK